MPRSAPLCSGIKQSLEQLHPSSTVSLPTANPRKVGGGSLHVVEGLLQIRKADAGTASSLTGGSLRFAVSEDAWQKAKLSDPLQTMGDAPADKREGEPWPLRLL